MKTYTDIEVVMKHLDEQDKKILALDQLIKDQSGAILCIVQDLANNSTPRA